MDANSHPASDCPGAQVPGQLSVYGLDDPEWVAMVIRRLRAGDRVTIDRIGDLVITDGP
jgi:hypothetical protein